MDSNPLNEADANPATIQTSRPLPELFRAFLKLGVIGFGGPAALIAMMQEEFVERRKWLTRDGFLDLVGMTNLIPGPNAVEASLLLGLLRGGWLGCLVAGLCFILPATLISLGFAWMYVQVGSVANVQPFFVGIKPAVLAIIVTSVGRLGMTAAKNGPLVVIGVLVLILAFVGVNEVVAMFVGALLGMLWLQTRRSKPAVAACLGPLPLVGNTWVAGGSGKAMILGAASSGGLLAATAATAPLWQLGLFFLKIGAVLYGGGYVLVAFLDGGLVEQYHWLSREQLLDAIAVGQITPGPLLSTVTFIGYLLHGMSGACVATVAVFLPSIVFVAALHRLLPRIRQSCWAAAFLDAVNISAVALMVVVAVRLGSQALADWSSWGIFLAAMIASLRWKANPAWLVLGGAVAGWITCRGF
jgi:chromate transporter